MNRRGFIDEINPAYVGLALIGAGAVWFSMRATGLAFRIFGTLLGFVVAYAYLQMTE